MAAAVALAAVLAAPGAAQVSSFPARSGESGLVDVPDAEVAGAGQGVLASEVQLDRRSGDVGFGPLPLYLNAGVSSRLELGLSMRTGGQAGDPVPAHTLFGGALKLNLVDGSRALFSMAVDGYVDRLNATPVTGGRFLLSSTSRFPVRVAALVGYERDGLSWGGAFSVLAVRDATLVLEALGGPRGGNYGVALWRRAWPSTSVSVGFNYLPSDAAFRVSVGFAFAPARATAGFSTPPVQQPPAASPERIVEAAPRFTEQRPHFRLKLRLPDPSSAEPRSRRHGPWEGMVAAGAPARPGAPAVPPARDVAPSLEELADRQLHEQEALSDARERRVRSSADQLDARESAAQEESRKLADQERNVAAREQQLELRERRLGRAGAPTQPQRDLEAIEAQLAAQERNLAAQERSHGPALDAAEGRVRDAAAREDAERAEASRLAASVSGAGSRAQQLQVRKHALAARARQLSAVEARLVARGERIDASERQLRAKAERLDVSQRRLDARSERLDLLEKRAAEPKAPIAAPTRLSEPQPDAAPKDKAVFVMVVKSPTAIVKERGATPAAPGSVAVGIQPGVAVEKAVAAATVVTFPSPAAQLSELDREAVDTIAKLAAKEGCELLIWARAKDPSLMSEAQRRAAEIRTRAIAVAQLGDRQIVTRITTRPGANGVDVVVSALRETSTKPGAAAGAAPARGAGAVLEAGEAGKRQIREAVQAAQPTIEACVADVMEQRKLARAEGTMRLTISAAGKVTRVLTSGADLDGGGLAECLTGASGSWSFPTADAEYAVDVPVTVIRGGAR